MTRYIMQVEVDEPVDGVLGVEEEFLAEELERFKDDVVEGLGSVDMEKAMAECLLDWYAPVEPDDIGIGDVALELPLWGVYVEVGDPTGGVRRKLHWYIYAETAEVARKRLPMQSGLPLGGDWTIYRTSRIYRSGLPR